MLSFKHNDEKYLEMLNFAKHLLKWFVDTSSDIYEDCFVSYNVHSLIHIHIHQDVENLQCGLQELSAFPFENFMQRIKRMVRKTHQALSQVVKRIKEMEISDVGYQSKNLQTTIKPAIGGDRNSWFLLRSNKICEVVGLEHETDHVIAKLYCFQRSSSFFTEPLNSKVLKICFLPKNSEFVIHTILKSDIDKKFVAIPDREGTLLIPTLHNLNL